MKVLRICSTFACKYILVLEHHTKNLGFITQRVHKLKALKVWPLFVLTQNLLELSSPLSYEAQTFCVMFQYQYVLACKCRANSENFHFLTSSTVMPKIDRLMSSPKVGVSELKFSGKLQGPNTQLHEDVERFWTIFFPKIWISY